MDPVIYKPTSLWVFTFDQNNINKKTSYIDITNIDNMNNQIITNDNDLENLNFNINNELIKQKINEIIQLDYKTLSVLNILKYQNIISKYLDKYVLQNNNISKTILLSFVNWLYNTSKYICNKYKINVNIKQNDNPKELLRCSYKFCSYGNKCQFFYSPNKKGCYSDHYVHWMIVMDLHNLIEHIDYEYNTDNDTIIQNKEIIKTINTIHFVIRHMYQEYSSAVLSYSKIDPDKLYK